MTTMQTDQITNMPAKLTDMTKMTARTAALVLALGATVAIAQPANSAGAHAAMPLPSSASPALRPYQKSLAISAKTLGELQARIASLSTAWAAHDVKAFQAEFFAPNACLIGEGMPAAACGQATVGDTLTHMSQEVPAIAVEVVMAHQAGDTIISWLQWHLLDAKGARTATMRSMTVWSKAHGKWRIIGDSYSVGQI